MLLLVPFPEEMGARPVSHRVNDPTANDASLPGSPSRLMLECREGAGDAKSPINFSTEMK